MAVKITKPEINIREKIAELDKPSGVAGEAMLRAETPQEQFNLISAGRRNLIINGAMQVAQRGTSKTGLGYGYHTADRIRSSYNGSVDTATIRDAIVETVLINQQVDGYTVNVLKRTYPNATDTGEHRVNYRVEAGDVAKFEGQTLTLSYYAKADVSLSFDNIWARLGGTATYDSTQSITTTWKRYTFSFVCPAVGSSTYMDIAIGASIANLTNTSIYVTMLQLEVGKVATPFEHRSYGEELALCQRYFERLEDLASTDSNGAASTETLIGLGYVYTTTRVMGHVTWKATKRVNPTCTVSPVTDIQCLSSAGAWISATGVDVRANKNSARLDITTGSAMPAAGQACEVRFNTASPVGYIYIDAEL